MYLFCMRVCIIFSIIGSDGFEELNRHVRARRLWNLGELEP